MVEWVDSKIIDFVKREECIEKCPKVVCLFYQNLFAEVIDDWNGVYQFEDLPSVRKASISTKDQKPGQTGN